MISVLLDDVIYTDYGQFTIVSNAGSFDGDAARFFAGQANGWVGADVPGTLHVVLGRRSGGSRVRIELSTDEPQLERSQDIVEGSVTFQPDTPVAWEAWAAETSGPLAIPPGSYRTRVSAIGRDEGSANEFAEIAVDSYLIQFWPAPASEDAILKTSSQDATYWNREWGSRRD
ncbi:hypothetical protein [Microbacterium murale]|uniref:Uncharacterized protein n=1 Tax=Microbacterium murale TaxID=1081040 RepID=A0ABU0P840_9MICO|nr:hypothetical protein [Microbacterium murale]MDQ0643488.1 hypothetical protein [Microbacterium murale]